MDTRPGPRIHLFPDDDEKLSAVDVRDPGPLTNNRNRWSINRVFVGLNVEFTTTTAVNLIAVGPVGEIQYNAYACIYIYI